MKRKIVIAGLVSFLLLFSFFGSPILAADNSTITVTDARGETIDFESPPDRIISFMPSNTEILFYLGAGDKVVGVDDFSDYPDETKELPKVGNAFSVNYEKIVNLSADVVVVPSFNTQMIQTLKDYDQKVVATGSTTVSDIYSDMKLLGKMCGIGEEAENKAEDLRDKMEEITSETKDLEDNERKSVFYITSTDPIYTPGNNTFQNTLLENAGLNNIASNKTGWVTISEEKIIQENPNLIIAPNSTRKNIEQIVKKDSWQSIDAVKNDNIFYVNNDLVSRPGPRIIKGQWRLVNISKQINPQIENNENESVPGFHISMIIPAVAFTILINIKRRKK